MVLKVNTIDSKNQNLEKKIEYVDKNIPDSNKFIVTQDFNRLTNTNFNLKMVEASKNLATQTCTKKMTNKECT